ncbi:hypothetical protein FACS1894166_07440 [Bacilli bacterium]|nr:hypothetical protein FACS1894166_07440 [Bacilli bacterium]
MSNKHVFDKEKYSDRTNVFNRPMMVLNYDSNKLYQKCYSMSSPKPKDSENDLIYYFLPRKNKIVLAAPIDIPNKYLIIFEPIKQMSSEQNIYVKEYLRDLENDRIYVDDHRNDILYQYQCIKYNSDVRNKFNYSDVQ